MGRKSPITEKQWEQIGKRMLAGETARALSREYGVSEAGIRKRFSVRTKQIKDVANQIVATEAAFQALPYSAQISARALADDLKDISQHLCGAARFGAATAHRVAGIANAMVDRIDDMDPLSEESLATLKGINALSSLANNSSEIARDLLKANKEQIDTLNRNETPEQMNWTINAVPAVSNAG